MTSAFNCTGLMHRFHKFPNCLCDICTRQLELLLRRGRHNSPTYPQDCIIFFIQLNNVHNKQGAVTLWKFPQPQGGILQEIPQPLIQWSHLDKHWKQDIGLPGLVLQSNSFNCIVLILNTQLGSYLSSSGESYSLTASHICKTLYKSMLTLANKLSTH